MHLKKKKMKFYKETLKKTLQLAVTSIASVVKTSISSCSSGKSQISNKNSSSGSREWTQNEIIKLIAIWKQKETLYKTSRLFYLARINDTKQY